MDWVTKIITNHLVIAFFSAFILVLIDIAGRAVRAISDSNNKKKKQVHAPDYLKLKFWWVAMFIVCTINMAIIKLYIIKGVVFTPALIVQVCLATTYSFKTVGDKANMFDSADI